MLFRHKAYGFLISETMMCVAISKNTIFGFAFCPMSLMARLINSESSMTLASLTKRANVSRKVFLVLRHIVEFAYAEVVDKVFANQVYKICEHPALAVHAICRSPYRSILRSSLMLRV